MTKHWFFFQATTKQPQTVGHNYNLASCGSLTISQGVTEGINIFVSVASLKKYKG